LLQLQASPHEFAPVGDQRHLSYAAVQWGVHAKP